MSQADSMQERGASAPPRSDDMTERDDVLDRQEEPKRNAWAALKRGARGRCPACGEGRLLHRYLKVHPACPQCGEELYHHRADDFPPYLTIFVVGHILGAAMFAVDDFWPGLPIAFHYVTWPTLCIVLSLWLLPMFKGALIAYQWALRMHGFETAHPPKSSDDAAAPPIARRVAA